MMKNTIYCEPHPRTKHGVNQMIRRGDIAIWIFQPILGLGKPETIRSANLENPTGPP